jgi:hypothetical protein
VSKRFHVALWLPPVMLGLGGVVAAASGLGSAIVGLLVVSAVGCVIGSAGVSVALRQTVAELTNTMAQVRDGERVSVPNPTRFGPLAPAGRTLNEIAHALRAANEAATTDRLTGVANRPTLLAFLFTELERVARYGRPLSVAFSVRRPRRRGSGQRVSYESPFGLPEGGSRLGRRPVQGQGYARSEIRKRASWSRTTEQAGVVAGAGRGRGRAVVGPHPTRSRD